MRKIYTLLVLVLGTFVFYTNVKAQSYCMPTYGYGCGDGDGVVYFQLNTITQSIPCSGSPSYYHDYTSSSTVLQPGNTYTLTIQVGYSSTYFALWIDLNNNYFFNPAELLLSGAGYSPYTNYTFNLTIPIAAPPGSHRLRILTNYASSATNPCSGYYYGNCSDYTVNIPAPIPPVASFTANTTTPVVAQTVFFTDQSTNYPTNWLWTISPGTFSFVGGTSASSQNPQVQFTSTGFYTVTLLDSNSSGSDDTTIVNYINVSMPSGGPVADFSASDTVADINTTTIIFTDLSAPTATSWQWQFIPSSVTYVNGTSSTSQNPQVQFNAAGLFSVQLIASNVLGSDTLLITDYITVNLVYCIPTTNYPYYGYSGIYNVQFNTINNTSSYNNDIYTDYSATVSTVVTPGMTYTLTVNGFGYGQGVVCFIDWNNNGILNDSGEMYYVGSAYWVTTASTTITVPYGATPGTHRIRIMSEYYNWVYNPCGPLTYGETEDYSLVILPPIPNDAGVVAIITPSGILIDGDVEPVTVVVHNFGLDTITSMDINYILDTGTVVVTQYLNTLAPNEEDTVVLPDITVPMGNFSLCAYTVLAGDSNTLNDQLCVNLFGVATVTIPYNDNFDTQTSIWSPSGSGSQWQLGTPSYGATNSAHSSPNAWDVDLISGYLNSTTCYLTSPFFDFTGTVPDSVSFWLNYNVEGYWDGTRLEYSTDGGVNWSVLGTVNDPNAINWYNYSYIYSSYLPAWSSSSGGWKKSRYSLFGLYGQTLVQFRFVFTSDGSVTYDGCSVDDFKITVFYPYNANNLGITSPVSGCGLGDETVSVTIQNYGSDTINGGLTASYYLIGGADTITEPVTDIIPPMQTISFSFATTLDLAVTGANQTFNLVTFLTLTGDIDQSNDSSSVIIESNYIPDPPVVINDTIPYNTSGTLYASSPNSIYWFNVPTGGMYIDTGSTFNTPVLYDTTCLWVEDMTGIIGDFTVGSESLTNTSWTYPCPYGQWYNGAKEQYLILASELDDAGIGPGPMTSLAFDVVTSIYTGLMNFTIKISSTTLTQLPTNSFATGNFTTVYSIPVYYTTTGWNVHNFTTPFIWDGQSNIIVEMCFDNYPTGYTTNAIVHLSSTTFISCLDYHSDGGGVCTGTPYYISYYMQRPNMKFGAVGSGCPSERVQVCAIVTGIPANDAGVVDILSPVSGFSLSSNELVTVVFYNWGTNPITNFPISYELDNGVQVTEVLTDTVYSGSSLTYTFSTPVDMSVFGTYIICAYTSINGDTYYTNDTTCETVVNSFPVYCNSYAYSTWDDDIGNVTFAGINNGVATPVLNNPNGWNTYSNFMSTVPPAEVSPGNSYPISISVIYSSYYAYSGYIEVYIDYDHSGTFDEPGEVVFGGYYNSYTTTITGTVNIPYNALTGMTGMRVVEVEGGYPSYVNPCLIYTWGETEDYMVHIAPLLEHDAGIIAILDPATTYDEFTEVPVEVTLKNFGTDNLTNVFIAYTVNGGTPVLYNWTGNLAFLQTENVTLDTLTIPCGYYDLCAYTTFLTGDLNYFNDTACISLYGDPQFEAAMLSIDAPQSGCDMTTEFVTVTMKNLGDTIIGGLTLGYQLDNNTPVTENITDTIYPGENYTHTFATPVDLTVATYQEFILTGFVDLVGDPNAWDDAVSIEIVSAITPADPVAPPVQVYTGATATLAISSPDPLITYIWYDSLMNELATGQTYTTPNFTDTGTYNYYVIAQTYQGSADWTFDNDLEGWTGTSECGYNYNWSWNSDGGYGTAWCPDPGTASSELLTSPVVNVSGLSTVTLSYTHRYYIENYWDDGYVLYRLDGGAWTQFYPTVGNYDIYDNVYFDPIFASCGWYYTDVYSGNQPYETHEGDINVNGAGTIEIAFLFSSDYSVGYQGWYIDEVELIGVGESCQSNAVMVPVTVVTPPWDAALTDITAPISGTTLSSSEPVVVDIYNNGYNTITTCQVSFSVNGGTPVFETVNVNIPWGQTYSYTFTGTADLSGYGTYTITSTVYLLNDVQAFNDSYSIQVVCSPPCTPYYYYNCYWGDQLTSLTLADIYLPNIPCYGGYVDYTTYTSAGTTTDFLVGETYDMIFTIGYSYQYVTVWIDFDNSNSYDSNEIIVNGFWCSSGYGPFTADFYIPETAAFGEHMMRVVDAYYTNPQNPCGTYYYGQTMDFLINIVPNAAFTLSLTGTNLLCSGANTGSIDLTVNNISGIPPFGYFWSNGLTDEDPTGLAAGLYSVTVTDAAGNTNSGSITLTQPTEILESVFPADVTTLGGNDGAADLWVMNGTPPYSYLWSNGATTEDLANLYCGIYCVTITDANGCVKIDCVTVNSPAPWTVTVTGLEHIIHVPANANITLDANPLPPGSFIGVFYHVGTNLVCGGYSFWNNMNTLVVAYGAVGADNGFEPGEVFTWKVWVPVPAGEHGATATYDLTYPQSGNFVSGGESGITNLAAITSQTQTINLSNGWSIFSTYIDAFNDSIVYNLQGIVALNQVVIVKNQVGAVYWPAYGLDNIYVLVIGQGYQIKTTQATSFTVTGLAVVPEATPIVLNNGWYIIGYLRQTPGNTVTMLSSIPTSCIVIVKNSTGQVYWPAYGLVGFPNMNPGEGYQIKIQCASTLIYPPNASAYNNKSGFMTQPVNYYGFTITDNNLTLGIPELAWNIEPQPGDEIGVFSTDKKLVGASVYEGGTTAVAVWGDDMITDEIDGMQFNEPFTIKLWHNISGSEETLLITNWIEGNEIFTYNGISVVGKFASLANGYTLCQNMPNPFRESTLIKFSIPEDTQVQITLYDLLGNKLEDIVSGFYKAGEYIINFDAKKYAAGTYFYQIITSDFVAARQMSISK